MMCRQQCELATWHCSNHCSNLLEPLCWSSAVEHVSLYLVQAERDHQCIGHTRSDMKPKQRASKQHVMSQIDGRDEADCQ